MLSKKNITTSYNGVEIEINKGIRKNRLKNIDKKIYDLDNCVEHLLSDDSLHIYINNESLERIEFYKMVNVGVNVSQLGKMEYIQDFVLIWIVEKSNNLKLYNFLLKRLENGKHTNIYSDNGYYNLRYNSTKINKDYAIYKYSNDFLEMMSNINSCLDDWISKYSDDSLLGKDKREITKLMNNDLNKYFFRYTGGEYKQFTLKTNVYDYVNDDELSRLFNALSQWCFNCTNGLFINDSTYWNKQDLMIIRLVIVKLKELLIKIMDKIELSEQEKKYYFTLSKLIESNINIYHLFDIEKLKTELN